MTAELDDRVARGLRNAACEGFRPGLAYLHMLNANHAAQMIALVEGRAFSPLPEQWFTYAGDAAARSGIPTAASFLWPKNQRLNREAKQRMIPVPADPKERMIWNMEHGKSPDA